MYEGDSVVRACYYDHHPRMLIGCAQELITWQLKREDGSDLLCLRMSACALVVRAMLLRMTCKSFLNALLTNRSDISMVVSCFLALGMLCSLQPAVSTRDPGKVPEFVNQEWWHDLLLSACTTLAD
jgi:hypothetical protein